MSRFRITASLCGQCAKEIESLADSLHLSSTQVKETGVRLTAVMSGAPKAQLRSCEQSLDEAGDAARALGRTLGELVRRYQRADGKVLETASSEKPPPLSAAESSSTTAASSTGSANSSATQTILRKKKSTTSSQKAKAAMAETRARPPASGASGPTKKRCTTRSAAITRT